MQRLGSLEALLPGGPCLGRKKVVKIQLRSNAELERERVSLPMLRSAPVNADEL